MQQVFHHAAEGFFLGRHGPIDQAAALDLDGQKPFLGHGGQQTGHRRIMPPALLVEHIPDLTHATRPPLPKQLEHFESAPGRMLRFRSRHVPVPFRVSFFRALASFYGFYHSCQWVKP